MMPRSEPDSRAEAELLGEDHDAMVRLYIKTTFMFLLLGLVLGGYITVVVNLAGRAVPWFLYAAHGRVPGSGKGSTGCRRPLACLGGPRHM